MLKQIPPIVRSTSTSRMLRILQVCNVGQITGGTAACAWTITRALPWAQHTVAFLSPVSGDTREAFRPAQLVRWEHVAEYISFTSVIEIRQISRSS